MLSLQGFKMKYFRTILLIGEAIVGEPIAESIFIRCRNGIRVRFKMVDFGKTIKEINELKKAIEENRRTSKKKLNILGKYLVDLEPAVISKTLLKDSYGEARQTKELVKKDRQKIKQIKDFIFRMDGIDNEFRETHVVIAKEEKGIESHYEEIGSASFRAFKESGEKGEAFRRLFIRSIDLEEEINRIENRLAHAGEQGKERFFSKALETGRAIYLNGLLKTKKIQRSREYQEVGKKACESDFTDKIADPVLSSIMEPVLARQGARKKLISTAQALTVKKNKLREEMKALGGREGARRPEKALEIDLKENEERLSELYKALGKIYLDKKLKQEITNDDIEKVIAGIETLSKQSRENERQIEGFEAEIEINKIEDGISGTQNRIERLKAEIEKKNEELESLNRDISRMEKEKKKLTGIRSQTRPHSGRERPDADRES